jgi:hypothetical protein
MAIWGHRCCTYSTSIYLSGNVDYNAFFFTFLPSACAPLWTLSFLGLLVVYTLLCQRCTCVFLASFLFLFCSLCLVTRYADIKP